MAFSWVKLDERVVVSEEAVDGRPDVALVQDIATKRWHVSFRTSAHWEPRTFFDLKEAKDYADKALVAKQADAEASKPSD